MKVDYAHSPYYLSTYDLNRQAGATHAYNLDFTLEDSIGDIVQHSPKNSKVELNVTLHSVMDGIFLNGKITAKINTLCAKCVKEREDLQEFDLNTFFPYDSSLSESDDVDENIYHLIDNRYIDLMQIVRDTLNDSFSFAPLCKDQCKEINTTFSNDEYGIDSRFLALRDCKL